MCGSLSSLKCSTADLLSVVAGRVADEARPKPPKKRKAAALHADVAAAPVDDDAHGSAETEAPADEDERGSMFS